MMVASVQEAQPLNDAFKAKAFQFFIKGNVRRRVVELSQERGFNAISIVPQTKEKPFIAYLGLKREAAYSPWWMPPCISAFSTRGCKIILGTARGKTSCGISFSSFT